MRLITKHLPKSWPSMLILALVLAVPGSAALRLLVAKHGVEEADPPEVALGERLFRETRFAQYFFRAIQSTGQDINQAMKEGDPTVAQIQTLSGPIPGPYAGKSMNCAHCHLVDELRGTSGAGMRAYTDFSRRTLIPPRPDVGDDRTTTPRNTPTMVNSTLPRDPEAKGAAGPASVFLHFDGQFSSIEDLVRATLTGRNFGWVAGESKQAIAHVARIIREDNGQDELGQEHGGSYAQLFAATGSVEGERAKLPEKFRLDVTKATDREIFDAVARLIGAYSDSLLFEYAANEGDEFKGSPYDRFLRKNGLPRRPNPGEKPLAYARRLRALVEGLKDPAFVTESDDRFEFQDPEHRFEFGPAALEGFRVFTRERTTPGQTGGVGNCIACHAPPHFTDFAFHNTGASQDEYDSLHGQGSFMRLKVPGLTARRQAPESWLPASDARPKATGIFMAAPSRSKPGYADLGLWNMFANPDLTPKQKALREGLCQQIMASEASPKDCQDSTLLDLTLARFKTPSLRDLGHSAPYLHTGQMDTPTDVITFYIRMAALSESGGENGLRNPPPEFRHLRLSADDVAPLNAFLESLNEDYN